MALRATRVFLFRLSGIELNPKLIRNLCIDIFVDSNDNVNHYQYSKANLFDRTQKSSVVVQGGRRIYDNEHPLI